MSILARFVGGPLNGQERPLPGLTSPFLVRFYRPAISGIDASDYPDYDEHRYDLDSRDYEARREEIDRGSPALFVHEDLENVGRLLAASLGNMISFEEAYERVAEAFEMDHSAPTIGPPVNTGRLSDELTFHAVDVDLQADHNAPDCESLPAHERCWPRGDPSLRRTQGHQADIHGYGTPIFDEAGGASAEDLVPGIEAALREWDETKEEMKDE